MLGLMLEQPLLLLLLLRLVLGVPLCSWTLGFAWRGQLGSAPGRWLVLPLEVVMVRGPELRSALPVQA